MITISNPTKYIAGLYVRLSNEKIEEVTNTNVITKVKLYQVKIGCMVLLLRQNREKRSLKILFQLICHQN